MAGYFEGHRHYYKNPEARKCQAEKEAASMASESTCEKATYLGLRLLGGIIKVGGWILTSMSESITMNQNSSRSHNSSNWRGGSFNEGRSVWTVGSGGKKSGSWSSGRHK
jgi:hypothetical protein